MDLASAFKGEVFRPLVTLVIPGATALAPYVILARARHEQLRCFWNDHTTAAFLVIALAAIAVGRVLETIGARIESAWDDILDARSDGRHVAEWYRYLRLTFTVEPIGQRYLRTLTLALKFELAMVPALMVMHAGILWLETEVPLLSLPGVLVLGLALPLLIVFLLFESWTSATRLERLRRELLEEYGRRGPVCPE